MINIGFEEETYWDSPFEIRLHSFQIMILLLNSIKSLNILLLQNPCYTSNISGSVVIV